MAQQTTNLHLTKPDLTDFADVRVLNQNFDILDEKVQEALDKDPDLSGLMPKSGGNFTGDITIQDHAVDYVIERQEQDRSYYEKYKSGKLVQVIYLSRPTISSGINKDTINFLTPFTDMSYLVWLSYEINVTSRYGWQNSALNPTSAGAGANGNTEPRWGDRSTTFVTVTADTQTDIIVYCIGRWK